MKKIPYRTCIITREKHPKNDLFRIVKNKDGEVFIDLTGKANGRGVYLKKDLKVIEKARNNKNLDRNLEIKVPESIYEQLIDLTK
ncbi:MAG: YlxR family protein [Mollicutes bacterium]|nr:YlxR family protein [Mollicutes bacterium]